MKKLATTILALALFVVGAVAQIDMPASSPSAEFKTTVGLTDIVIKYSRPGVKGRTIFSADGLQPFGKVWRFGANSATSFMFSDDVKLAGQEIKAGEYAVLCTPGEKEFKFMMYPYEGRNWSSYTEKDPMVTFGAAPAKLGRKVETFTIDVNNVRNESASIDMLWENTLVSIPLDVNVDERVVADIKRVLNGPAQNDYYAAASYYHDAGKDLNQALEWIKKANAENPRFWMLRRESLILADMNKYKDAIAAAKKSLDLATQAGNEDYIRLNEKSINNWNQKLKNLKPESIKKPSSANKTSDM